MKKLNEYKKSSLWEKEGIKILILKGTPYEIGYAHGKILGRQIQDLIKGFFQPLSDDLLKFSKENPELLKNSSEIIDSFTNIESFLGLMKEKAKIMEKFIPEEYKEEIMGLAKGSSLDYETALIMQTFVDFVEQAGFLHINEFFHSCTHFTAFNGATKNGDLILGRNLDWTSYGIAHKNAILFFYQTKEGNDFVSVAWSGCIGALTGFNFRNMSLTEESLTVTNDVSFEGIPVFLLGRLAIQQPKTLEESLNVLINSPRTNGYHFIICDSKNKHLPSVVFECCAHKYAIRHPYNNLLFGVEVEPHPEHYRDHKIPHPDIPITDESSRYRYKRLKTLVQENYGNLDVEITKRIFSDKIDGKTEKKSANLNCLSNNTTLHSVVYLPSSGELHLAQGTIPAPDGGYIKINLFTL